MNRAAAVVDRQSAGMRLDRFVTRCLPATLGVERLSRSGIQKLIAEGQITLNGQPAKAAARLKIHDLVVMTSPPPKPSTLAGEPIALNVIFEDDDCVVINKSAGMVVHPAAARAYRSVQRPAGNKGISRARFGQAKRRTGSHQSSHWETSRGS
jgi:23S rRNA pseudouridine1911/1915/1917 synthase